MLALDHPESEGTLIGTTEDRQYQETHPWITFTVDLRRAPVKLWMLLGEARSKCEHIAGVPLRPATANDLHVLYLAKGARATTAIEGNTLSEEEVSKLVSGTLELPPSKEYLGKEVNNILAACNGILENLMQGKAYPLTPHRIKELNSNILDDLSLDEGVEAGEIRTRSAGVARYRGAPPQDCEYLLGRLCDWLDAADWQVGQLDNTAASILKAIIGHLYVEWIHPFGDGNGRTGRLIEYQILVNAGVPSPAAHLLSNHYNETRSEYYRQLDRASQTGDPIGFLSYALQGFVDGLHAQLELIKVQQWKVAWENLVHGAFRDRNSAADTRRRHLALDLSVSEGPVPPSGLRTLTTRLAAEYAGKTSKAITRDINALQKMGLVKRERGGVVANNEMLLAFLPFSGPTEPTGA